MTDLCVCHIILHEAQWVVQLISGALTDFCNLPPCAGGESLQGWVICWSAHFCLFRVAHSLCNMGLSQSRAIRLFKAPSSCIHVIHAFLQHLPCMIEWHTCEVSQDYHAQDCDSSGCAMQTSLHDEGTINMCSPENDRYCSFS